MADPSAVVMGFCSASELTVMAIVSTCCDRIFKFTLQGGADRLVKTAMAADKDCQHFHFIGICGTAMGAVAAAMKDRGCSVTGSDEHVYAPMSTFLGEKGIIIKEGYRAENIPPQADVVVIGNAMSRGNAEVEEVLERRLPYTSLPELL